MGSPAEPGLAPVAVALQRIIISDFVVFRGVDLDTGLPIQIGVDRHLPSELGHRTAQNVVFDAAGLMLTLTIEPITSNS